MENEEFVIAEGFLPDGTPVLPGARLTDEAMSERIAKAMAVFVDTVNMTVTQQKEKVFVIPDNIEEFDFRNYV